MRIIAGEYRGRRLLAPEGDSTRPITDRVKQSLFDILAPRIGDAVVFDIFSGTGSMGLESLSRSARSAWFFEADRSALRRLNQNIQALGLGRGQAVVVAGDLFRWFATWDSRRSDAPRADLVFLDPPYRFLREKAEMLQELGGRLAEAHLAPGAQVVFRHDAGDALELPALACVDRREYGGMVLEFLEARQRAGDGSGS